MGAIWQGLRYRAGQGRARIQMFLSPKKSHDEIHEYWKAPDPASGNQPEHYVSPKQGAARSQFLLGLVTKHVDPEAGVLEVGCNVGRNLEHFWENGYSNLSGIEISPRALEVMRETYPALAEAATLHQGPAEEILPTFEDRQFDLVFTMAVLVHIHPSGAETVLENIARVTGQALIVVEDEQHHSWRHFRRNYRDIFEALGLTQQEEILCGPLDIGLPDAYVARVFTA